MLPLCQDQGLAVTPWSPLARGRLARPADAEPTKRLETDQFGKTIYSVAADADGAVIDRVQKVAQNRGLPMAQVSLAWMLSKPAITSPIVGATKPHHLEDAVAAVSLKLTAEEIKSLEAPYVPHPVTPGMAV